MQSLAMQNPVVQNGHDSIAPSQKELALFYRELVKLRDDVLAGKNPRIKLSEATRKNLQERPSVSLTGSAAVHTIPEPSDAGSQALKSALAHNQTAYAINKSVAKSSDNKSPIDPCLLVKNPVLVAAEDKLARERIHKQLKAQWEQKQSNQVVDTEQLQNVDEILKQAQAIVPPITAVRPVDAAARSSTSSFDENDYYSSKAGSPWSIERGGEVAGNESIAVDDDRAMSYEPPEPEEFRQAMSKPGPSYGISAPSSYAAGAGSFPGLGNHTAPTKTFFPESFEDTAMSNTDDVESDYSPPAPGQDTAKVISNRPVSVDEDESDYYPDIGPAHTAVSSHHQSPQVPIIKNHLSQYAAPQPERVSPLAFANMQSFGISSGSTPNQARHEDPDTLSHLPPEIRTYLQAISKNPNMYLPSSQQHQSRDAPRNLEHGETTQGSTSEHQSDRQTIPKDLSRKQKKALRLQKAAGTYDAAAASKLEERAKARRDRKEKKKARRALQQKQSYKDTQPSSHASQSNSPIQVVKDEPLSPAPFDRRIPAPPLRSERPEVVYPHDPYRGTLYEYRQPPPPPPPYAVQYDPYGPPLHDPYGREYRRPVPSGHDYEYPVTHDQARPSTAYSLARPSPAYIDVDATQSARSDRHPAYYAAPSHHPDASLYARTRQAVPYESPLVSPLRAASPATSFARPRRSDHDLRKTALQASSRSFSVAPAPPPPPPQYDGTSSPMPSRRTVITDQYGTQYVAMTSAYPAPGPPPSRAREATVAPPSSHRPAQYAPPQRAFSVRPEASFHPPLPPPPPQIQVPMPGAEAYYRQASMAPPQMPQMQMPSAEAYYRQASMAPPPPPPRYYDY